MTTYATPHPPCQRCGHVHRVTRAGPNSASVTYDQGCACGCTANDWRYHPT